MFSLDSGLDQLTESLDLRALLGLYSLNISQMYFGPKPFWDF